MYISKHLLQRLQPWEGSIMALIINLHSENQHLVARIEGKADETRTLLTHLPPIERLQADPFTQGKALTGPPRRRNPFAGSSAIRR